MLVWLEFCEVDQRRARRRPSTPGTRTPRAPRERGQGLRRPTSASTSSTTACRSTAASASRGSTTSTSTLRRVAVNRAVYGSPEEHKERLCALLEVEEDAMARRRRRRHGEPRGVRRARRARGSTRTSPKRATRRSPITSCRPADVRRRLRGHRVPEGVRRRRAHPPAPEGVLRHRGELGERVPAGYMVSIGMLAPTLLDHGSELLKQRHLPRMLRGDEEWMQLLSEPSGGSDMAGALTRLTRDGDSYVLNGSKMWSSGAAQADYGLCLARTDWDAPKHRGLSTIAVPLKGTPGLTIDPIRAVTGVDGHFCPSSSTTSAPRPRTWSARRTTGWAVAQTAALPRAAARPPAPATATGSVGGGSREVGFGGRGVRRAHRRGAPRATPLSRRDPPADRRLVHRAHRVAATRTSG